MSRQISNALILLLILVSCQIENDVVPISYSWNSETIDVNNDSKFIKLYNDLNENYHAGRIEGPFGELDLNNAIRMSKGNQFRYILKFKDTDPFSFTNLVIFGDGNSVRAAILKYDLDHEWAYSLFTKKAEWYSYTGNISQYDILGNLNSIHCYENGTIVSDGDEISSGGRIDDVIETCYYNMWSVTVPSGGSTSTTYFLELLGCTYEVTEPPLSSINIQVNGSGGSIINSGDPKIDANDQCFDENQDPIPCPNEDNLLPINEAGDELQEPSLNNKMIHEYEDKCAGFADVFARYPNKEVQGFVTLDNKLIITEIGSYNSVTGPVATEWKNIWYYGQSKSKGLPQYDYAGTLGLGVSGMSYYVIPVKARFHTHVGSGGISTDDMNSVTGMVDLNHWIVEQGKVQRFNGKRVVESYTGSLSEICNNVN